MQFDKPHNTLFDRRSVFCYVPHEPLPRRRNDLAQFIEHNLRINSPLIEPFYYYLFKYKKSVFVYFSTSYFEDELSNRSISTLACCALAQSKSIRILFIDDNFIEINIFNKGVLKENYNITMNTNIIDNYEKIIHKDSSLETKIILSKPMEIFKDQKTILLTQIPSHQRIFYNTFSARIPISWQYLLLILFTVVAIYIKIMTWSNTIQQEWFILEQDKRLYQQYIQLQQQLSYRQNNIPKEKIETIDLYHLLHTLDQLNSNMQIYKMITSGNHFSIEATLDNPFTLINAFQNIEIFKDISIEYVEVKGQQEYFRIKGIFNVS